MQMPVERLHVRYHVFIHHQILLISAMIVPYPGERVQRSRLLERLIAIGLSSDEILTLLLLHQAELL